MIFEMMTLNDEKEEGVVLLVTVGDGNQVSRKPDGECLSTRSARAGNPVALVAGSAQGSSQGRLTRRGTDSEKVPSSRLEK